MTQQRLFPKPLGDGTVTPFGSAVQAWFWFVRCQAARIEGARVIAGAGEVTRPCDPDDIYNAVMRLYRGNVIGPAHLQVLEYFGMVERFPDPRDPAERPKADLWRVAIEALEDVLVRRAIVVRDAAANGDDPADDADLAHGLNGDPGGDHTGVCPLVGELPPCRY